MPRKEKYSQKIPQPFFVVCLFCESFREKKTVRKLDLCQPSYTFNFFRYLDLFVKTLVIQYINEIYKMSCWLTHPVQSPKLLAPYILLLFYILFLFFSLRTLFARPRSAYHRSLRGWKILLWKRVVCIISDIQTSDVPPCILLCFCASDVSRCILLCFCAHFS